jgi:adenine/guanine phosphoribosyltransferase-like PRPP-binding protein
MAELFRPTNQIEQIKSLPPEIILGKTLRVNKSFIGKPVFRSLDGYTYCILSITDFFPPMNAELIEDMADLLIYYGSFDNIDLIVSEADRGGGPLTQAVALKTNIPYTLANWYPIAIPWAITVKADVGFSGQGNLCIFGPEPGKNVIIVDDLISTGGTAAALIEAVRRMGANINKALFVGEKVNMGGRNVLEDMGVKVTSLVKFSARLEDGVTVDAGNLF